MAGYPRPARGSANRGSFCRGSTLTGHGGRSGNRDRAAVHGRLFRPGIAPAKRAARPWRNAYIPPTANAGRTGLPAPPRPGLARGRSTSRTSTKSGRNAGQRGLDWLSFEYVRFAPDHASKVRFPPVARRGSQCRPPTASRRGCTSWRRWANGRGRWCSRTTGRFPELIAGQPAAGCSSRRTTRPTWRAGLNRLLTDPAQRLELGRKRPGGGSRNISPRPARRGGRLKYLGAFV